MRVPNQDALCADDVEDDDEVMPSEEAQEKQLSKMEAMERFISEHLGVQLERLFKSPENLLESQPGLSEHARRLRLIQLACGQNNALLRAQDQGRFHRFGNLAVRDYSMPKQVRATQIDSATGNLRYRMLHSCLLLWHMMMAVIRHATDLF